MNSHTLTATNELVEKARTRLCWVLIPFQRDCDPTHYSLSDKSGRSHKSARVRRGGQDPPQLPTPTFSTSSNGFGNNGVNRWWCRATPPDACYATQRLSGESPDSTHTNGRVEKAPSLVIASDRRHSCCRERGNLLRLFCLTTLLLLVLAYNLPAAEPTAWVANTVGETLSRIDLKSGQVTNNLLVLGSDVLSYPNQVIVRDTLAYIVCSGTDEIQIVDLSSVITVGFISTGAASNPFWMAFLDSRYAYVSSFANHSLIKLDMATGSVVDETPIGTSPEGVIIHDFKVYVAVTAFDWDTYLYGQGKVAVYDTHTDQKLLDINVGMNPQYLATDQLGRIHVICTGDYWSKFGIVYVIDPTSDSVVDSIAVGGSPGQLAISLDDIGYLAAGGWVGDGYIYTYHALTGELLHGPANPLVVDSGCMMAVAYQDSTVFVGGMSDFVTPIDSAGSILDRFALGDGPVHLDFNYVPGDLDGSFVVDIGDLVMMVDWYFTGGEPPLWPKWRANIDGDFAQDISDLVCLVDYMFTGGPPPQVGPTWLE